jgi:hypothetical protein
MLNRKNQFQSQSSMTSDNSTRDGKELLENWGSILLRMSNVWISLILNVTLLWILVAMASPEGLKMPSPEWFHNSFPMYILIWIFISYVFTSAAMNNAAGVLIGYLLSRPAGFSLSSCYFERAPWYDKIRFASRLSVRSKAKKLISRLSLGWGIHAIVLLVSLVAPVSVTIEDKREFAGYVGCVEYSQLDPFLDRKWPTLETAMGVAEYAYGTSLGNLRSANPELNHTTFLMSPQLTDTCSATDEITGNGFSMNIRTHCKCSTSTEVTHLIAAGADPAIAARLQSEYIQLQDNAGFVNHIAIDDASGTLLITTLLSGTIVCGSRISGADSTPVCKTSVFDFQKATTQMEYMTDGTPASIAAKIVELISLNGPSNITWMGLAYQTMLGGEFSTNILPGLTPGSVNSILWWATPNTLNLSPVLLESGLEVTFGLIARGAIQRSFSAFGSLCDRRIINPDAPVITISRAGYLAGLALVVIQLFGCVFAIGCFSFWLFSPVPIGPAIRIATDHSYFINLINRGTLGTKIWQQSATTDR